VIAAMTLGEIEDSTTVPALAQAYAGGEPRLRYAIVNALSGIDDSRGDAVLALAARDSDSAVRRAAAEALKDRREARTITEHGSPGRVRWRAGAAMNCSRR
jgi:HEAT repeat protein